MDPFAARHGKAARTALREFDEIVRTIAFAGTEPVLDSVLPIARSFLEAEQALAYRLECHESGLDVDFAHCVGAGPMDRLLREVRPILAEAREPLPAFILDRRGAVAHANEAGRALPHEERARLLERARSLGADGEIDLLPIHAQGIPSHAFLVQRAGPTLGQRLALFAKQWQLTPRQAQVLKEILEGRANKEIAAALGIREKTVELHVTALLRKVGVESRSELLAAFWTPRR